MVNEDFNLGETLLRDEKQGLVAVESEEAKSAPDENVKAGEIWQSGDRRATKTP